MDFAEPIVEIPHKSTCGCWLDANLGCYIRSGGIKLSGQWNTIKWSYRSDIKLARDK